ncbi:MAG: restriction endonuclease subunit S [Fimbriimonadaceae bacterium]
MTRTPKALGTPWSEPVAPPWTLRRLKDVARVVNGFPFDSKAFDANGEHALVRIRDLNSSTTETRYNGPWVDAAAVDSGDVLIGMDGDFNVGTWRGGPALLNQRMCCVRGETPLMSRYLRYVLPTPLKVANDLTYYTTVKHLSALDVERFTVPVPPMSQLATVVDFLDEQTARIDALIAEKERLNELLGEYRSSLISAAVTGQPIASLMPSSRATGKEAGCGGGEGDVGVTWPTTRLRYVADLNPAVRADLLGAPDTEVSFLPMEAIGEDGSLKLDRVRPVSEVRNGYSYFEDGDVAFAKVTPCFENGKGALMRNLVLGAGFGTSELTVLRPKGDTSSRFLNYVVQSQQFRQHGAGAMTGAGGLKRVPDEFTRDFKTPWPPRTEQERIANFLDEQTARIDALREHVRAHIERLREYRSSLISAAVTGQLDLSTFKAAA